MTIASVFFMHNFALANLQHRRDLQVQFDMLTHLLSHTHVNAYIINHKGNEAEKSTIRFDASCRAPFVGDGR